MLARLIRHARVKPAGAARLLGSDTLCATDLAEWLVMRGVVFGEAHAMVGRVVADAERRGVRLRDLTLPQLRRFSKTFDRSALQVLDPRRSVARKRSLGSTNPRMVHQALTRWRQRLK